MTEQWVLVGDWEGGRKVFGPFASADDARACCNGLGMPDAAWQVEPLLDPAGVR